MLGGDEGAREVLGDDDGTREMLGVDDAIRALHLDSKHSSISSRQSVLLEHFSSHAKVLPRD